MVLRCRGSGVHAVCHRHAPTTCGTSLLWQVFAHGNVRGAEATDLARVWSDALGAKPLEEGAAPLPVAAVHEAGGETLYLRAGARIR